jgi:tRNA A-37 threonylcarbamoyl transferase component Bud32
MRLAQRNAIYDGLKTRGQETKEVDQKRYRPKRVDKNIRQRRQNPWRRSLARGWQLPSQSLDA